MTPFFFHPEAYQELIESVKYYEVQKSGLGQRFLDTVIDAIQRIRTHPLLYHQIDNGCRQCRIPWFPYGVIYRIKDNRIEIIAVMHLHRQPGYWRGRN